MKLNFFRLDKNNQNQSECLKKTMDHIKEFAEMGLRTLCLAIRDLTNEEFFSWQVGDQLFESKVNL